MATKETRKMAIYEGCMFIAEMREHKTWYDGKTVGYPCSITDNGDGTATIISTREAFHEWDMRNEYSSPCVYRP